MLLCEPVCEVGFMRRKFHAKKVSRKEYAKKAQRRKEKFMYFFAPSRFLGVFA